MTDHQLPVLYYNFKYQEIIIQFYVSLLPEFHYVCPPPLISACIGYNITKILKEKQKVILQFSDIVILLFFFLDYIIVSFQIYHNVRLIDHLNNKYHQ